MLKILRHEKIFCEINELIASDHDSSSDEIFLGGHSELILPVMIYAVYPFYAVENCLSFGLLVSCLSLS